MRLCKPGREYNKAIRGVLSWGFWARLTEMLASFALAEFIASKLGVQTNIQYVDLRMLIVALLAGACGVGWGIAAAGTACACFAFYAINNGVPWQSLLYQADNWIPCTAYFILALVLGTSRRSLVEKNAELIREIDEARKREAAESASWEQSLSSLRQANKMLALSRGGAAWTLKTLRALAGDEETVLREAAVRISPALDYGDIAIYRLRDGVFTLSGDTAEGISAQFKDEDMLSAIKRGVAYRSDSDKNDMPDCAVPIMPGGCLKAVLAVWNVPSPRMTDGYISRLTTLADTIALALERADREE